jgi:type IV pilus assembly protein PilP
MKMRFIFLFMIYFCFLALIAMGCGKKEKPIVQQVEKQVTVKAPKIVKAKEEEAKSELEQVAYHYDPAGKTDPFRPLIVEETKGSKGIGRKVGNLQPLQKYDLDQLKLVGIISDANPPRALIEDVAGDGYIVTLGTVIGRNDGVVTAISENEVVVEEKQIDIQGKLAKKSIFLKLYQPEELEEK